MNNYQVKGINPFLHAFFEGLGLTVNETLTEQELKDYYKIRSFQEDQEERIYQGSGVSEILSQSIVYMPQIDYSGDEPEPTDLDILLFGKELVPFRWQKKLEAILFLNDPTSRFTTEFNNVWQGIVNLPYEKKPYRYLARKQTIEELNDRPFFPFIPNEIRKLISDRYGIPFGTGSGDEDEVLCIPTEEEGSFWDWWIDYGHPRIPLFITEGAKKSLSLLSIGCLAVALYGCQCGSQEGKTKKGKGRVIKPALAPFLPEFATIILAMDNDSFGNFDKTEPGKVNLIIAARNACSQGSVYRLTWDPKYKGVDDLIVNNPSLFEDRLRIALYPHFKNKMGILIESIYTRFGSALRFNLLSKKIELDGEPIDTDGILAWWYKWFPYSDTPSLEHLKQALRFHSKQNQYNPVKEFLEYLDSIDSVNLPPVDVSKLSTRFLKTEHPFYDILLYKTLLAAVARVMKPGCQVDTVCVLQGSQGLKKSTFWTSMAVFPDWCRRNFNATYGGKDGLIAIGRYWFLELDEIEAILSKKDVESFKSMVTARSDGYRPPYGTQEDLHPRHSIFVGSCNKKEFLKDFENRRIWMIPVSERNSEPSPLEVLSIWKQMVAEYHKNRQWWLTPREEEIHKVFTKEYCQADTFVDVLSENSELIATQRLTTTEIAIKFLGFENVSRLSRNDQNRLAESLRYLGFELIRETRGKNRDKKIWVMSESQYPVSTQSVPTSNPYGERVSENDKKSVPMSVPTSNPDGERVPAVLGTDFNKNPNSQNVSSGNKEKSNSSQENIKGTYNIEFEKKPKVSTQMPETGSVTGFEVGTDKKRVSTQKTETGSVTGFRVGTDMGTDFSSGYPEKVKWDDKWKDCPSVYLYQEGKKNLGRLIDKNTIVYPEYNKTSCQWFVVKTSKWEFQAIAP